MNGQIKMYWRKKGDLKDTETRSSNTNKAENSKITKENSTNKMVENARGQTNNRTQKKQNNFGVKYGNRKNVTERLIGLIK